MQQTKAGKSHRSNNHLPIYVNWRLMLRLLARLTTFDKTLGTLVASNGTMELRLRKHAANLVPWCEVDRAVGLTATCSKVEQFGRVVFVGLRLSL